MRKDLRGLVITGLVLIGLGLFVRVMTLFPCNAELEQGMTVEECRALADEHLNSHIIEEERKEFDRKEAERYKNIRKAIAESSKETADSEEETADSEEETETAKAEEVNIKEAVIPGDTISKESNFKGISYAEYMNGENGRKELLEASYLGKYGVRYLDGKPLISLNSGFGGSIGDTVSLELSNGKYLDCVVADFKEDDSSVVNIICNKDYVPDCVLNTGTYSSIDEFSGEIIRVVFK